MFLISTSPPPSSSSFSSRYLSLVLLLLTYHISNGEKFSKISSEFKENQTTPSNELLGADSMTTEVVSLVNETLSTLVPPTTAAPLSRINLSSSSTIRQYPTTSTNSSTTSSTAQETTLAPGTENRLRWVMDYHRHPTHQSYPPRMPNVPGIPSGFRNPFATPSPQNPELVMSPITMSTTTTTTTTTTTPAPAMLFPPMLPSLGNQMYNPIGNHMAGHQHPSVGSNFNSPPILADSSSNYNELLNGPEEDPFKLQASQGNPNRRYNITRVEHIVAECSDDFMKVVLRFNGSFTGLVYSSGYANDPNCIYVNGSGRGYYEFYIRLNQCGTLGRQEMYHPSKPGEARRRDQLMWNTLAIQYNALIEEEFDEIFRLTCEYGSDFWKTVTFPAINVEVNTGSPVVFTLNPPQCQMEIRRGFGIAGSRTAGPVTVGDPLTLLIHMKSEKAGFDILVKNCVAHNGARQRLQLIDNSGCVINEKLISPFRGVYNPEANNHVSLYSYLKAFRFTGSPALYLECDIHMCHNRCPPQRCYWRNLSKRSADDGSSGEYDGDRSAKLSSNNSQPILSESISLYQALEVKHEQDQEEMASSFDDNNSHQPPKSRRGIDDPSRTATIANVVCLRPAGLSMILSAFVFLMMVSISSSICYCAQMRAAKQMARGNMFAPTITNTGSSSHHSLASAASVSDCSRILATPDSYQRFSRFRS